MKNLNLQHYFLIITLLTFSSCGLIIKSYIRKDSKNVPTDFGKEKTTILVIKHQTFYNRKVDKIFKKYYTGEYVFVQADELKNKYADSIKYRYILNNEISINEARPSSPADYSGGKGPMSLTSASHSFIMTDRKTKEVYETGISSGVSWKKILQAWLKKLDSERKKEVNNL